MIYIWLNSGRTCGAVWTFERYIDYELEGFVRDVQTEISKTECEDLCLSESRWWSFGLNFSLIFFSFFWSIWLLTFYLKVLLSICYLRPFDEGVPIEWGRQVRIWKKVLDKIEFFQAHKMINRLLWFLLTHTLFRFSQPGAYRVKQGSDYLENQCESRKCYITHVTFKCKINLL